MPPPMISCLRSSDALTIPVCPANDGIVNRKLASRDNPAWELPGRDGISLHGIRYRAESHLCVFSGQAVIHKSEFNRLRKRRTEWAILKNTENTSQRII